MWVVKKEEFDAPTMDVQGLTLAQQKQFDLVSFRVSWSQAILFGCYEVGLWRENYEDEVLWHHIL